MDLNLGAEKNTIQNLSMLGIDLFRQDEHIDTHTFFKTSLHALSPIDCLILGEGGGKLRRSFAVRTPC